MNDRREFLKTTAAVSVMACLASTKVLAADAPAYTNIIYTAANPGSWAGKEGSHAPQVTVQGGKVSVVTPHPMSADHFIVRHALVLEDSTVVGAKTFTAADKPESMYELPAGYKGKITVTSFCNLHDFWLTETMV